MKAKLTCLLVASLLVFTAFKERPEDKFKLKKTFTENYAFIPQGTVTIDGEKVETQAFYMLRTELSNLHYREFLERISETEAEQNEIQSEKWEEAFNYTSPYKEHYHTHPAYENYPVGNVTKENAEAYCAWLTEHYTKKDIGLPEGYKIVFRLPTRAEWVNAANGELKGPYAWGGPFVRNAVISFLANFRVYGAENTWSRQDSTVISPNQPSAVFQYIQ